MIGSLETWKLPQLSLVVGGARSGKSRLAERLVTGSGLRRHYIATAQAWDDEMRARIAAHQTDRGAHWVTHESPRDVAPVLAQLGAGDVVLVDCATLWLTNVLLAEADIASESAAFLAALTRCAAPVVIVSNEVGWGIVPDNALARAFRDHQGRLNQQIAAEAQLVLGVMAGLPMALKGQLPAGFHQHP
ncbi:bifunctional adenosylcobinamide kinase/adenosylcobinamide-phosphate guanylyltransferase [bacterium]|nr:bifunctional adenosylcobinamide kinase/adenosylcobinamide-phosphate guanylyltransferase [bacterium]